MLLADPIKGNFRFACIRKQEVGRWKNIDILEGSRDRDFIVTKLLERILREERVQEVRAFLEKGAVAHWFDPEVISELLM